MDERICANTCSFDKMMRQCFSETGDNVFRYRLHIAIDRAIKAVFLIWDTVDDSMMDFLAQEKQTVFFWLNSFYFLLLMNFGKKQGRL